MLIPFDQIVKKYGKPNGILHVGANVGEEAEAYDKAGVNKVIWIEANPDLIPILKETASKYGHDVIQACVGDVNNEAVTFHISNNAGQSSSYLDLGTHKIQHPDVHYVKDIIMSTIRLDTLFAPPANIISDFLNLDIQGAELRALRGMGDMLKQFRFIYSEVNRKEVYKGCALLPEMDAYLRGFGFRRVAIAPWIGDWTDALWIKR